LAYDYKKDELYAQNLDLLNDRLEKYNVESHELDWFKEIFCESGGVNGRLIIIFNNLS
jgi:hypothetical protein